MTNSRPPEDDPAAKGSGLRKDEHWRTALKLRMKKDEDKCEIWKDEVQNILVFSGLFSAIVTAFLIESHKSLRQDSGEQTVQILSQIAAQLTGNTTVPRADLRNAGFLADNSSIRINVFWFLSLVVSLTTALVGIISLQWIRIHLRVPSDDARLSLSLFHMYSLAMDAFYVPHIFASLPVLLILGLALFLIGLIDFLLKLNTTVAIPIVSAIGLTLAFLMITTTLPGLQSLPIKMPRPKETPLLPCPYRSPQSLLFLRFLALMKAPFRTTSVWLARWVDDHDSHDHEILPNWFKGKIYPFLSQRFPEFLWLRPSWQWKDDWASHGQFWLIQRDLDHMELLQPSSSIVIEAVAASPRRPAVFDAVQALRVLDCCSDSGILRCIYDVMEFKKDHHLQYTMSCFPESYYVPPADFLAKNCDDDGVLRDFAFIAFKGYTDTPALMDISLRTALWLFDTPRIFPAGVNYNEGHPLKYIGYGTSYPPSVCETLLTTLNRFFNFAAEYHPEAEYIDKTTHTSRYTYHFLADVSRILTGQPPPATAQTEHDNILSNITVRLEEDGGHDYLYLTASTYASSCLYWRETPWPLGGTFISTLSALKLYKVGFETRRQADQDLDLLARSLCADEINWILIDSAITAQASAAMDDSLSPPVIDQGTSLHGAHSSAPHPTSASERVPAINGSEGPSGSVISLERGGLVGQEGNGLSTANVLEANPPLGPTGVQPLHDHTLSNTLVAAHVADTPDLSAPATLLEEIVVVSRGGGERYLRNSS